MIMPYRDFGTDVLTDNVGSISVITNFSHNTLSIDHKIQYANGEAFVCEEHTDAKQPSVKLDMTTLYKRSGFFCIPHVQIVK